MALVRLCVDPNEATEQRFEIEATVVTVGSADDNDIVVVDPSISPHHFKIELRPDGWHLVDLRSKLGLLYHDEKVQDARLERGSIFQAGGKHLLFDVTDAAHEAEEVSGMQLPTLGKRQELVVSGMLPCWRCQQPLPPGTLFCPACGSDQRARYAPSTYVAPLETPMAPGAGLMPFVAFLLSVLGPVAFGFGWLAGIILGFVSLTIIRKRGGHVSDVRKAHAAIYIGLAWAVLIFGAIGWYLWYSQTTRAIARNERRVAEQLRDITVAEAYYRISLARDRDGDGVPEYGTLAELVSNGYGNVNAALARGKDWSGYRFDMLQADESDFCVVAEPQRKGITGQKTFLVRSDGYVCGDIVPAGTPITTTMRLRRLSGESALVSAAQELVDDLHKVAEAALRGRRYEAAMLIVQLTRTNFPSMAAGKLDGIERQSTPFVVEIRARELLAQSSNALASGESLRALETLQTLRQNYPTFSGVEKVDEQIRMLRDQHSQKLEQNAQQLLEQAIGLDLRLAFAEAEAAYHTVANQYQGTSAAKEALRRIEALAERKKERNAAALVEEALSLNLDTEYKNILSRIDQLTRTFGASASVSQAQERLAALALKCQARIYTAAGDADMRATNTGASLTSYLTAAERDPAHVRAFATNYAAALRYGVSNALAVADFRQALRYAELYQELRVEPERLALDKVDTIRFEVAQLEVARSGFAKALALVEACGDRLNSNAAMSFLAGKIYLQCNKPDAAALAFQRCLTQEPFAAEARLLLLRSAAQAALAHETNMLREAELDEEWTLLLRTYGIALPAITSIVAVSTSTWQSLCVQLCDHVEMTYELLTYSGSEADLFVEKERERQALNGEMRRLQQILKNGMRARKAVARSAQQAADWWAYCWQLVSNTAPAVAATAMAVSNAPAGTASAEAVLQARVLLRKQSTGAAVALLFRKAYAADDNNKGQLLRFLNLLVTQLENKQPVRNVLNDIKQYLSDQRAQEYSRQALAGLAELSAIAADPAALAAAFTTR